MNIETNQPFKKKDFKNLSDEDLIYIADMLDGAKGFQKAFSFDSYCAVEGARSYIKKCLYETISPEEEAEIRCILERANHTKEWCGELTNLQDAAKDLNTALCFHDDIKAPLKKLKASYEVFNKFLTEEGHVPGVEKDNVVHMVIK